MRDGGALLRHAGRGRGGWRVLAALLALLAWVGLLAGRAPAPSYTRQLLWQLAAYADVVAAGEIVAVDAETFEFRVDDAVLGTQAGARLRVRRFENWTCHGRWAPYAEGQRLLVFLRESEKEPGRLRAIGGGNEGEMPLLGGDVVVENTHGYRVRGFALERHAAFGEDMRGTRVPYDELRAAALGFRETFRWNDEGELGPRTDMAEVERFSATSRVAGQMAEEAVSWRLWIGPIEGARTDVPAGELPRILAGEFPQGGLERWAVPGRPRRRSAAGDTRFGEALAVVGDVDGDGVDELLASAHFDAATGHAHGAAWLLFLDAEGGVRTAAELRERNRAALPPMNEFARFGSAVAALGDLDGDSLPDVAVGAPGWDGTREGQGGVWVLFLARDGSVARAVELGASPVLAELGVGEGAGLGNALACLGDLDGDGTLELAVGQDPKFDLAWEHGRAVHVVSLARDGTPVRATRIHGREHGFEGATWFGDALCAPGDVDGDGVADLAIGDSGDDDGGQVRGAVWIANLARDGTVRARQKLSDWHGGFDGRLTDWSRFGRSLAGPGDLDGDGVPDLLVGSTEGIWTISLATNGVAKRAELLQLGELAQPPRGVEARDVTFGVSLACGAHTAEGTSVASGGDIGRGRQGQDVVWWLRLTPEGRLVGR